MSFIRRSSFSCVVLVIATIASAEQNEHAGADDLVPQRLLALVHAPQVHRELGLNDAQVSRLEAFFADIDGPWFRSRILPAEKQYAVVRQLEQRVKQWFADNTSAAQRERLEQLEYQAQGTRALLRDNVARSLRLDASQRDRLFELARATVDAQQKLQAARLKRERTEQLESAALAAAEAEREGAKAVIRPEQARMLSSVVGKPFDTTQLERIYPMAPEFKEVEYWLNSEPLRLKQLRGKVVLVHFYAFQCHNCHANFEHYRRWQDQYGEDVVVIGVQTPETAQERDFAAVKSAAAERNLNFPIIVDLQSKNWDAWANTMWPTIYVVDQNGYLRYWWQGELNWQGATGDETIENLVNRLLKERKPKT